MGKKKNLYTKAQKAIYGMLRASLLFWKKITDKLAGPGGMGFVPNLYNSCTMNTMINGISVQLFGMLMT